MKRGPTFLRNPPLATLLQKWKVVRFWFLATIPEPYELPGFQGIQILKNLPRGLFYSTTYTGRLGLSAGFLFLANTVSKIC